MVAGARAGSMPVVGPNGIGLVNVRRGLDLTMLPIFGRRVGGLSAATHSGAMIEAMAASASRAGGVGFNLLVSAGNEAVTDVADYLDYFAGDEAHPGRGAGDREDPPSRGVLRRRPALPGGRQTDRRAQARPQRADAAYGCVAHRNPDRRRVGLRRCLQAGGHPARHRHRRSHRSCAVPRTAAAYSAGRRCGAWRSSRPPAVSRSWPATSPKSRGSTSRRSSGCVPSFGRTFPAER